MKTSQMW